MDTINQQITHDLAPLTGGLIEPNITHSEMQDKANDLIKPVTEGYKNPLYALEELKALKQILDYAIEKLEPLAIDEVTKYGRLENLPAYYSSGLKLNKGRTTYDYSNCPAIVELEDKLKAWKEIAKKQTTNIVDGDVLVELVKPIEKYGKESISVTFRK